MKEFSLGYFVDEDGGIHSTRKGKLRKLSPQVRRKKNKSKEYLYVEIAGKKRMIAHIVLEAFGSPRPEGMFCRHLNDDTTDNRLCNLAWGTNAENVADAALNGRHRVLAYQKYGEKNSSSKLTADDIRAMRKMFASGASKRSIARKFKISPPHVRRILCGINWPHIL